MHIQKKAPDGSIYYFNENTRQTTWDRPTEDETAEDQLSPSPSSPPPLPPRNNVDLDEMIEGLTAEDLSKLEVDRLQKEWIRHQGYVEMKMISEKDAGSKLSSWKAYYAVLSNGFLLLYKESHAKNKVKEIKGNRLLRFTSICDRNRPNLVFL